MSCLKGELNAMVIKKTLSFDNIKLICSAYYALSTNQSNKIDFSMKANIMVSVKTVLVFAFLQNPLFFQGFRT